MRNIQCQSAELADCDGKARTAQVSTVPGQVLALAQENRYRTMSVPEGPAVTNSRPAKLAVHIRSTFSSLCSSSCALWPECPAAFEFAIFGVMLAKNESHFHDDKTQDALLTLRKLDPSENTTSAKTTDDILFLDLSSTPIRDNDMWIISTAKNLQQLELKSTSISDLGLSRINNLQFLRSLDLAGTRVSDAGIVSLLSLKRLFCLNLDGAEITHHPISWLAECDGMKMLTLSNTNICDSDLTQLANCKKIEILDVSHTYVSGDFLKYSEIYLI